MRRLPIAFQGTTYRCSLCGMQSTDPNKLCEPVRERDAK